ncbi:AMP phosphorylase [Methanogenium organophilum]|uniref:AMP phosphorylase n=1 Tax=Methanogenium organophilum TaxID=2199 RepID=A0A9X9S4L0_METOG|nr:AMP phosphorylase [Methanogenium organophilum]WAI01904.1 AMP phosphorylase [Methanogenium organophilum]
MQLLVQRVDIAGRGAFIHEEDARRLGVFDGDRLRVLYPETGKSTPIVVDITTSLLTPGTISLYNVTCTDLGLGDGDMVEVHTAIPPSSIRFIRKKMDNGRLTAEEVLTIVRDMVNEALSLNEITAFVTASYINGLDIDEVESLTRAMVETGEKIEFAGHPVVDKHSIGGVPGNKITLLVVPIIAAAGLTIPKTSSRAITGAGGTADLMEVLAPVNFTAEEVQMMTDRVGGVIVWGGSTNIAPADDLIIRVEYPFKIDERGQMIASVMAKKFAVGAEIVVIDIPVGPTTKVHTMQDARRLAQDFIEIGSRLGMQVECAVTYGDSPVGRAIGPNLEVAEALSVLEGAETPNSLIEKSVAVAGILLEMAGKAQRGEGEEVARSLLASGAALEKFREIIAIQGGKPDVRSSDIIPGAYQAEIPAPVSGYVVSLNNSGLVTVARIAGAPHDKGAGIYCNAKIGTQVRKGETIYTIYAESQELLNRALEEARRLYPVVVEGMLLDRIPQDSIELDRMD